MSGRSWESGEATVLEVRPAPANASYAFVLVGDVRPRLADLHAQGALTDAEFAAEKAKLLAEE
jgi:hypothetical protein